MGKRRLAYAINYKTEGWYVLVTLKAPSALPREIERNLGNMEAILRYLFVKLEEKRSNVKPRPVRVAPLWRLPLRLLPLRRPPRPLPLRPSKAV